MVVEPPKILHNMSSGDVIHVREGEKVELLCNVTGLPTPKVTWYRINTGLADDEQEKGRKSVGKDGEVLIIHNVSRYCDDKYECVADNGVPPRDTKEIRVHVEFPPEVRLPNKKLGQTRGKPTILECEVTAYPLIRSAWRRDGKDIIRNSKYATEMYNEVESKVTLILKIQSLDEDDYGEYECYAINLLGHDAETMVLYEYHKPEEKTTTATRTWLENADEQNGQKQFYQNGQLEQWNTNGDNGKDYNRWNDQNIIAQSGSSVDTVGNRHGLSQYSGLKNRKLDYEPEAESESVISGPQYDSNKSRAHSMSKTVLDIFLMLLIHRVCVR